MATTGPTATVGTNQKPGNQLIGEIFNVSDMEIVMSGKDPKSAGYNYRNTYSYTNANRNTPLTTTEKERIKAYTVLDTTKFQTKCSNLINTANTEFGNIISELERLRDSCGEKYLSLNGQTMQDDFDDIIKVIQNYILQIDEYAEALIDRGKTVSAKQETAYKNTVDFMNKVYEMREPKYKMELAPPKGTVIR